MIERQGRRSAGKRPQGERISTGKDGKDLREEKGEDLRGERP